MRFFNRLFLSVAFVFVLHDAGAVEVDAPVTPLRYPKPLPIDEVRRFSHALEAVRALYVDDVDDKRLLENAIAGMLEGLDPHSSYLNEKDFKSLNIATEGEFSGLGIEVAREHDVVRVISPIDDTPAYRAGVKSGDLIIRIDGRPIKGMTLNEAVNQMRGKKGTPIELTIIRKSEPKPIKINVIRDTITIESVKSWVIDGEYGYIRVSSFQIKTGERVHEAIANLHQEAKKPLKGVVLDLRNNPGGVLQSAVDVVSAFLDANRIGYDKKVVYTKGRLPQINYVGLATGKDDLENIPMVVLINMGSASAAEIVAAALQDHHRAVIMGTQSFGKGSVQTVLPLEGDQTAIKLTTALYYAPSGRTIQAKGVTPDVVVEELSIPETVKAADYFFISEAELDNRLLAEDDHPDTTPVTTATVLTITTPLKKEDHILQKSDLNTEDMALMDEIQGEAKDLDTSREILYKDYQLHEAVNLLKGLNIIQGNVLKHAKLDETKKP